MNDEVGADVVESADAGMIERRHSAGFAFEALAEIGLDHFERDRAVDARVARLPDFAHAAFAQRRDDLIRAGACAW